MYTFFCPKQSTKDTPPSTYVLWDVSIRALLPIGIHCSLYHHRAWTPSLHTQYVALGITERYLWIHYRSKGGFGDNHSRLQKKGRDAQAERDIVRRTLPPYATPI